MVSIVGGASRTLVFNLLGNDISASAAFDKLGAKMGEVEAESNTFKKGMVTAGKGLLAVGAVAGVTAVETVKMASAFQQSMVRISTQAGVPKAAIKGLSDGVLDLAGQVGTSPGNLSDALYHIESAFHATGLSAKNAMDLLRVGAEGAKIGGSDLVDTQNALDAAVVSGIKGAQNYTQAMGLLNATVGTGDMKMQDLADAMGTGVMVIAKQFGVTLTDAGAALATFGDSNIRGAKAGTMLRMSIQAPAEPTKAGIGILKGLGISAGQLTTDMQKGGLKLALEDLQKHLVAAGDTGNKVGGVITNAFGKRAGAGVTVLIGQFARFEAKYPELTRLAGGFSNAWAEQTKTFSQNLDDLKAGLQALGIKIGTMLMPYVQKAVEWLGKFANEMVSGKGAGAQFASAMTALGHTLQDVGGFINRNKTLIGGLAVSFTAGYAALKLYRGTVILVTAVTKAWAAAQALLDGTLIANPIGIVIAAVAALVAGMIYAYMHCKTFRTVVDDTFNGVKTAALAVIDFFRARWPVLVPLMTGPIGLIAVLVIKNWSKIKSGAVDLWHAMVATWHLITSAVSAAVGLIETIIRGALRVIETVWHVAWVVVEGFVRGAWTEIRTIVSGGINLVKGIVSVGMKVLSAAWSAIWGVIGGTTKRAWSGIQSTSHSGMDLTRSLVGKGMNLLDSAWQHVWSVIGVYVKAAWIVMKSQISKDITSVRNIMSSVTSAISHAWDGFWSTVSRNTSQWWHTITDHVSSALTGMRHLFSSAVHDIGAIWGGILGWIEKPIKAVFGFINSHVIKPLSSVTSHFGLVIPPVTGFAGGGVAEGVRPGYTPGRDTHLVAVGGGEAIMRPEWTRGVGSRFVNAANHVARSGGPAAVRRFMASGGEGYLFGGIIKDIKHVAGDVGNVASAAFNAVGGVIGSAASTVAGWVQKGAQFAIGHVLSPLVNTLISHIGKKPDVPIGFIGDAMKMFVKAGENWGKGQDAANAAAGSGSGGIMNFAAVAKWVMGHLNIPYLWGGTGPRYDCSGFTQAAERAGGVGIPRTAAEQQAFAKGVSGKDIIPGDLGFLGRPAHHVELYMGNGKWAEAPHTGDVTKIIAESLGYFTSFGRVGAVPTGGGGNFNAGVGHWAPTVAAMIKRRGMSSAWQPVTMTRIGIESGGQTNPAPPHDSNWPAHPSVGLMQLVNSTFRSNAGPYLNTGPFSYGVSINPSANIYAGLGAEAAHGIGDMMRRNNARIGYKLGTPYVPQDGPAYLHQGEAIIPAKYNQGGGQMHVHIHVDRPLGNPKDIAAVVVPALEAWRRNGGRSTRLAI